MATMHPAHIDPNTLSDAERLLFEAFQHELEADFHVFHSVTWTGDHNIPGECDFIIYHRAYGFAVLEVKGGGIEVRGDIWLSHGRGGLRNKIKDPAEQARTALYTFRDLFRQAAGHKFPGVYTWGVCFPQSVFPKGALHRDLNKFNTLDAKRLGAIRPWLIDLFTYAQPYQAMYPVTAEDEATFFELLDSKMSLPRSLLFSIYEQRSRLEEADRFQDGLLDLFADKPRLAFWGAAGTGKTALALKLAVRLAETGAKTLFLCRSAGVRDLASRAGRDRFAVETFDRAAGLEAGVWEALVVDESADCPADLVPAVEALLNPELEASAYLFYSVFGGTLTPDLPLLGLLGLGRREDRQFHLRTNIRNTRAILDFAVRLTGVGPGPSPASTGGTEPAVFRPPTADAARDQLGQVIRNLTQTHGLGPEQLVVLTEVPTAELFSGLDEYLGVRVQTPASFGAGESDVVLYVHVPALYAGPGARPMPVLYQGLTRARFLLFVWFWEFAKPVSPA